MSHYNSQLFRAHLSDISISGFKLNSLTSMDIDKMIFVTVPGMQTFRTHVRWVKYHDYGWEFTNTLHPAVLEHLISELHKFG